MMPSCRCPTMATESKTDGGEAIAHHKAWRAPGLQVKGHRQWCWRRWSGQIEYGQWVGSAAGTQARASLYLCLSLPSQNSNCNLVPVLLLLLLSSDPGFVWCCSATRRRPVGPSSDNNDSKRLWVTRAPILFGIFERD